MKDESFRFGLNAFKVLGGSFAMARYIAKEMGRDVSEMTYDYLTSEAFRKCSVGVENTDLLSVGREYRLAVLARRVEDTVLLFRTCL